jgi:hypothetical protein
MPKQPQPVQPPLTREPASSPEELYLVSRVYRKLVIPAKKRSFPNKETLEFTFQPGIPQKVPAYVAKSYAESYPHVYCILSDDEAESVLANPPAAPPPEEPEAPVNFNVVEFLNNNHPLLKDRLSTLGEMEIFLIADTLELNPGPNTPKGKLIEQILTEVEARNKR